MIFAAIDIGSNAVRLLVANVLDKNGKPWVHKQTMVRAPVRLGEDVYENNRISEIKKAKLLKAIEAYKHIIELYEPVAASVFATAAMRDAENGAEVLSEIKNCVPWPVEIINGEEEASILLEMFRHGGEESEIKLLIDLGGGSTEMTILCPNGDVHPKSFKIGAVRMLQDKISEEEWSRLHCFIEKYLPKGRIHCIGSGGNINALKSHFSDPLEKYISVSRIRLAHDALSPLPLEERISRYLLRPDRADVIVPAAQIFLKIMNKAGVDRIYVPRVGLPEGMILRMYRNYLSD
ncbi:MAG: Ppx/GppA family phosphatase [Bacteroidales bacterium]|nr:Ppx/GppA family phosphatase [Bacteroidales bacterium]